MIDDRPSLGTTDFYMLKTVRAQVRRLSDVPRCVPGHGPRRMAWAPAPCMS